MRVSAAERQEIYHVGPDPFLEGLKDLIESGSLASMSESALKSDLIVRVQTHSAEIPFTQGEVSESFLAFCDLMVNGELTKMEFRLLKVFIILVAYNALSGGAGILLQQVDIHLLAGIADPSDAARALEDLRGQGYIQDEGQPALVRPKLTNKRGGHEVDKYLFF
jgi:hypothetical protein